MSDDDLVVLMGDTYHDTFAGIPILSGESRYVAMRAVLAVVREHDGDALRAAAKYAIEHGCQRGSLARLRAALNTDASVSPEDSRAAS